MERIIIFAAPSGSGKTTIVSRLLRDTQLLSFSISATTRQPRGTEKYGVDYYFISVSDFESKIQEQAFLEWEMVYEGKYYGTLISEIDRISVSGSIPILDIDVVGATRLKEAYPDNVHAIFIKAPNMEVLEQRLIGRGTESEMVIQERLEKARYEMSFEPLFDHTIINADLDSAIREAKEILQSLSPDRKLFMS